MIKTKRLTAAQQKGASVRARGRSYRGGYTRSELKEQRELKEKKCEVCKGTTLPLFKIGKYKLICKDCWEKEKSKSIQSTIKYGTTSYNKLVNKLNSMSKQELYDYCKKYGIKEYSGKTKQQRVDLIVGYRCNIKMGRADKIRRKVDKYPRKYPYRSQQTISNDIDYVRSQIKKTTDFNKKTELTILEDKLMVIFRDF